MAKYLVTRELQPEGIFAIDTRAGIKHLRVPRDGDISVNMGQVSDEMEEVEQQFEGLVEENDDDDFTEVDSIDAGDFFEKRLGISSSSIVNFLTIRENLGSTAIGSGVAIPHGRIKGLKEPVAVLMKLASPIEFFAPDNIPVSIMIFLLVPEIAVQQHLEILSSIAQLLLKPGVVQQLTIESDPEKLYQLLSLTENLEELF
jgi:PTS system nitrogen regulatory IIA component